MHKIRTRQSVGRIEDRPPTSCQLYSLSNEISFIVFSCIICKIIDPFMPSRYKLQTKKLISNISVDSNFEFLSCAWLCVFHCSNVFHPFAWLVKGDLEQTMNRRVLRWVKLGVWVIWFTSYVICWYYLVMKQFSLNLCMFHTRYQDVLRTPGIILLYTRFPYKYRHFWTEFIVFLQTYISQGTAKDLYPLANYVYLQTSNSHDLYCIVYCNS